MKTNRILAITALLAALCLAPAGRTEAQQSPASGGAIDQSAQCLEAAWSRNVTCQKNSNWAVGFLCAVRFEAEALLCVLGALGDVI